MTDSDDPLTEEETLGICPRRFVPLALPLHVANVLLGGELAFCFQKLSLGLSGVGGSGGVVKTQTQ